MGEVPSSSSSSSSSMGRYLGKPPSTTMIGSFSGFRVFESAPPLATPIPLLRPVAYNLTDFGGVGDGRTLNTEAFEHAVRAIAELERVGGGQLNVPPGQWLTSPFNLTSHMTLFLAEGAEILGIQNVDYWPLMPPLPSYGHGREQKGPRYGSLIHGQHLTDVVITGQCHEFMSSLVDKISKKLLRYTRGPLVQLMWSSNIIISNITLRDSPFWTLHPYDCKNVTIANLTILAPVSGAPNTDGIDPDSCQDMVIENCYISVGDDAIAIKSGWDHYGIAYGRPSTNILIRDLIVRSEVSAGISIGSEMSGGVSNITVENVRFWDSKRGVRIKTAPGRGGYIQNISYRNLTFDNVRIGIMARTDYNEHPDDGFDPKDLPVLENISFKGIYGRGVRIPVMMWDNLQEEEYLSMRLCRGSSDWSHIPAPCDNFDLFGSDGRLVRPSVSRNFADVLPGPQNNADADDDA
uniref:Polygalacturonase n=1 Tax=Ananas comosus var. bracteatus TaxID=296719 RepID=A0A6V7P9K1_ANACO|nr:unnamed protein product [Ananas comosus var. bracteatus]